MAAGERGRRRQVDGRQEGPRGGRADRRPGRGARRAARDLRDRQVRRGQLDRRAPRSPGSISRPRSGCSTRQGKLDQIRVAAKPGVSPATAHLADPRDPAAEHRGPHRGRPGQGGREGHRRVHLLPPLLPARVRPDRALRRRVRDRQLALDHDRAADARARDAAHARRVAAPGADVRRGRGARDGRDRVGRRALPRARARQGAVLAVRRGRLHAAEQRPPVRDADDRRLARRSGSSSR